MGDALAVCLMQLHNFKAEDFAKYHPGALRQKIIARVKDMLKHFKTYGFPDTDKKSDFEISEKRLGVTTEL
jgi:arabinose-5-phosphate isomerase